MMVIIQNEIVPVLLHLDQIHRLLLVITIIVNQVTQELTIEMNTTPRIHYGMAMDVIMLITIAVLTLICLGFFDNLHHPRMIILRQESVAVILFRMMISLWKPSNCIYSNSV